MTVQISNFQSSDIEEGTFVTVHADVVRKGTFLSCIACTVFLYLFVKVIYFLFHLLLLSESGVSLPCMTMDSIIPDKSYPKMEKKQLIRGVKAVLPIEIRPISDDVEPNNGHVEPVDNIDKPADDVENN